MRNSIIITALVALLAVGTLAFAQAPQQATTNHAGHTDKEVIGTVVSVDAQQIVVWTADNGELTFDLQATTEKPEHLAANEQVKVVYHETDELMGNDLAVRIVHATEADMTDPTATAVREAEADARERARADVDAREESITGTVVSVDEQTLVIRTEQEGRMTFNLQADTEKPMNLQRDDRVEVFYQPSDVVAGNDVALRVVVADDAAIADAPTDDARYDRAEERPVRAEETTGERELPRTASRVPTVALMGLLSLLAAAGLGLVARSF